MAVWRTASDGIIVAVRLTPKADRDAIGGITALADGREVLQARVRALPSDGAANAALVALLAKVMGVPRSAVTIAAGQTQRTKQVRIEGDPALLVARLEPMAKGAASR